MNDAPATQPRTLQVMLRRLQDAAKLRELMPEHLQWSRDEEKKGTIFLSGPTEPVADGELVGMTVFQTASREAADALAKQDPMVRSGAMTYALYAWRLNEGRITLHLDLSDHTAALD